MFTDDQLLQIAIGATIVDFLKHEPEEQHFDDLTYFKSQVAHAYELLKEQESNNQ